MIMSLDFGLEPCKLSSTNHETVWWMWIGGTQYT